MKNSSPSGRSSSTLPLSLDSIKKVISVKSTPDCEKHRELAKRGSALEEDVGSQSER
jgi:hypothetical protein